MKPLSLCLASLLFLAGSPAWPCTLDGSPKPGRAPAFERIFSPDCSEAERTINAQTLIEPLRDGEFIHIQRGRIEGPLDFTVGAVSGSVQGSVMVLDSEVLGEIHASKVKFLGDMLFWNTRFNAPVDFSGGGFLRFADFRGALFRQGTDFSGVSFSGAAGFINVAFGGWADFSRSVFEFPAGFGRSTFSRGAIFSHAQFRDHADFSWASFGDQGLFHQVTFLRSTDFSRATFNGPADFTASEFWGKVSFRSTSFRSDHSFEKSHFHEGLSTGNLIYGGLGRFVALLISICTLSLFLQGTAINLARGYGSPRSLFRDPAFLILLLSHLGVLALFYELSEILSHPPSQRELLSFLLAFYSMVAASSYPAFLYAQRAADAPEGGPD